MQPSGATNEKEAGVQEREINQGKRHREGSGKKREVGKGAKYEKEYPTGVIS